MGGGGELQACTRVGFVVGTVVNGVRKVYILGKKLSADDNVGGYFCKFWKNISQIKSGSWSGVQHWRDKAYL